MPRNHSFLVYPAWFQLPSYLIVSLQHYNCERLCLKGSRKCQYAQLSVLCDLSLAAEHPGNRNLNMAAVNYRRLFEWKIILICFFSNPTTPPQQQQNPPLYLLHIMLVLHYNKTKNKPYKQLLKNQICRPVNNIYKHVKIQLNIIEFAK